VRSDATTTGFNRAVDGQPDTNERMEALMKAKLLHDAGAIAKGKPVEIKSTAGSNEARSDKDVGGRSTTPAPVYEVTDSEGNTETVDTRDLQKIG
jgi:hypothetical protein